MRRFFQILFTAIALLSSGRIQGQNFNFHRLDRPWSVELGVGPGWTYADNSSAFRRAGFQLLPSASAALSKIISPAVSLRSTIGFQSLQGNFKANEQEKIKMGNEDNAYHFEGQAYYVDFAPVFRFISGRQHVFRSQLNVYGSIGVGALGIISHYDIMENNNSNRVKNNMFIPHIPFRAGVSYRLLPTTDLALEGSVLFTFRDDIDGHTGYNRFNDHLLNMQVKIRKYFSFEY